MGMPTTLPSISSLIRRVLSIFRQKMDGPNTSEMDIKVFILAPTFRLKANYVYSINGEKIKKSHSQKKRK